jgi:hypothetical protein
MTVLAWMFFVLITTACLIQARRDRLARARDAELIRQYRIQQRLDDLAKRQQQNQDVQSAKGRIRG